MGLFRGRTVTTRANKISDFTVATASYGGAVPVVYGTSRLAGNVIYYDDFTAHEHKETQRTGKGGKSKSVSITYTYTVAVILGLCEGPIHSIGKVWLGKDVYQYPSDQIGMTLYDGSQKTPWPYVKGKHPDKALTYENLAYMAGVIDLGDSGSMPDYNFEVRGMLTATGDGTDANPADVIRDILDKVGLSGVEIIGLDNYRRYCREADLLVSSPTDTTEAKAAHDIINELMTLTNAYMFWSNNKFKIVCKADRPVGSWTPDTTIQYDLTADDFLESNGAPVTCQRKDSSEIYNRFPVEFISRKNSYETETVAYELKDDIAEYGLRQAGSTTAHWFYTKERAVKVAEQLARDALYGRNKFTFKLDWAFCRLEVGDLVTLTDRALGLDKTPVMIDSVTENTDGTLTFTAISRPPMQTSKPAYDVHEGDRPYIDYNADAPDTDTPLIMQPPAELTTSGLEVWIGAKGKSDLWGGCEVYVADDGTNYRAAGTIAGSARVGTLAKAIKGTDTSVEISCNGTFLSGSQQDAERGNTLCWIDGECLSYQGATLLDNGHWRLDGCIRGQHTTTAAAHDAGAQFARLDVSMLRIPFLSEDVGKKVYLKFVSFNVFGAGVQDLATVKAYEYTIKKYYIPAVKNVRAYNRYRHLADGVSRYDVVVQWDPPDLDSYATGQVWYRTNAGQMQDLTAVNDVPASELGYYGKWIFGGQGKNEVVIPQAVVGDTYEIAVTTVDKWAASTDPDLAPKVKITVAMKTMVPNTPDGFILTLGKTATAAWNEVANTDVMYYEVKKDKGDKDSLVRTTGLTADLPLTSRSGTLYLFAVNALGKYSLPAVLNYNKPKPPTPTPPVLASNMTGFQAGVPSVPEGALGCVFRVNNADIIKTLNRTMAYNCKEGIYNVTCAYYDLFGEGDESATSSITVKLHVDQSHLDAEAVSLDKVDKAVKAQLDSGVSAEAAVRIVNNNLSSKDGYKNYTALTQLDDAINLRVEKDKAISQINLCPETITLDGKFIHVTGDTVFDNNVIANGMIQAGAVSADKLAAQTISLTDKLTIAAGQVNLDNTGLKLTGSDGGYTKFDGDGIKYVDSSGIEYASVRKMIIGKAYDGQYVKFAAPWSVPPSVMTVPMSIQTNAIGYDNVNTFIVCEPTEVSANGFRVNNYLKLESGAYSLVKANIAKSWTSTEDFGYTEVRVDGYMVLMDFWQDVLDLSIPNSATSFETSVQFVYNANDDAMSWNGTGLYHKKDSRYHSVDGWHQICLQLIVGGKTVQTVWSTAATNDTTNSINTTLSAKFEQGATSVKVRAIWKGQVRNTNTGSGNGEMQDNVNYINSHKNDAAMCWAHLSRLTIPSYKYQSGESKIGRGYAMFLVTDGGTNNYTLED